MNAIPLLDIRDLTVEFATRNGAVTAIERVSFAIGKGETVGVVGESGSGKSVTSYAVMRILDRAGRIAGGSIVFGGIGIDKAPEKVMTELRGREMSMVFQNPRAALNPIRAIGRQIEDVLIEHALAVRATAKKAAIEILRTVKIANPEERYHAYPFELSGGMCQRVVIAIALACRPQLLIADEPTTGLDVTTQKTVMDLMVELTRERGMSSLLITHDLGLAAAYCDRIVVMEKGKVVEQARTDSLFADPTHPYTKRLLRATPRLDSQIRDLLPEPRPAPAILPRGEPLLEIRDMVKEFPARNGSAAFRAVDGISFTVHQGESLGLVGESGCGKSTTSAMVMRLLDPTSGAIRFDGTDIAAIPAGRFARSPERGKLQMVFQDPTDSLNPRWSAFDSIADPMYRLAGMRRAEAREKIESLARLVGLPIDLLDRFPHQLSGGQKARVGIARAIALDPKLLILDEPTAALDVSVQAVVLNLLADLKVELGMSYLFISHDLNVVRLICDRVMVMRQGRIIEEGETESVLRAPADAYTRTLLEAIPHPPGHSTVHARPEPVA
ncbi:MAG: ABC transporter ATP-binding protein [Alphaproteobacteria bacterium]|nr:ABC transporter ATP-binding protein [Alphaproteobacteria bacterium]MBU0796855.1 ABC transporter ATP-binding protein [Alphaproteobacteria bacterium]MBU0885787.1 ABC transporter ATP-binding protein [Alphaproteobacteria bacterium]MBU1812136.1 ABC transporter ATP-binding protein [Alphaproteobacteria bacterium]